MRNRARNAWLASVVMVLFLGALLALMLAVAIAVREIYRSHLALRYEVEQIGKLDIRSDT